MSEPTCTCDALTKDWDFRDRAALCGHLPACEVAKAEASRRQRELDEANNALLMSWSGSMG